MGRRGAQHTLPLRFTCGVPGSNEVQMKCKGYWFKCTSALCQECATLERNTAKSRGQCVFVRGGGGGLGIMGCCVALLCCRMWAAAPIGLSPPLGEGGGGS